MRIGGDFYDITGHITDTTGYFRIKKQLKKYEKSHFDIYKLVEDCRSDERAYKLFKKHQLIGGNKSAHELFCEIINEVTTCQ